MKGKYIYWNKIIGITKNIIENLRHLTCREVVLSRQHLEGEKTSGSVEWNSKYHYNILFFKCNIHAFNSFHVNLNFLLKSVKRNNNDVTFIYVEVFICNKSSIMYYHFITFIILN